MTKTRRETRQRRKRSIRKRINGTAEKPRVYVFKSHNYLYVGVADDEAGKVLTSDKIEKNTENAEKLGEKFAKKLKKLKISEAVFDRSGYKFHGVVKAFVEGLRENGITI